MKKILITLMWVLCLGLLALPIALSVILDNYWNLLMFLFAVPMSYGVWTSAGILKDADI